MKTLAIIFMISLLLAALTIEAEAKSKSFTLHVSCTVPARLELSLPINEALNIDIEPKIQTQQIRYRENQKEVIYTIVER